MTDDVLVDLRGVCYSMGSQSILEDITLTVAKGEIVTMIGPNGSGKTTLVKIMLGILNPTSGTVVRAKSVKIGYAPQDFRISRYLPITPRSLLNSTLLPSIDVNSIVELVGIDSLLDVSLHCLSGGELKLVMLAKALISGHSMLVLDELASCFDLNQKDKFYKVLRKVNDALGCAIVLVSHDLLMIMQYTDKVLCINKSLCCSDNPRNVAHHPAFVKLFGDKFQNIAIYDHDHHCHS